MTYLLSVKQDKATILFVLYKSALDRLPVRWLLLFSVAQSCLTLCNLMDCSTPGLPVPHHLPEFAQVHVHWWHQWCHPAISSSDTLFFCPQSLPASRTFPKNRLLASDDQNTETSASALVFPVNIQGWSPLRLTGFISLLSKGDWTVVRLVQFSSVQSLSHVWLFETPWITTHQASLSITNSWSLLKLMSIESVMPSSHLILSFPSPPAPNPSQHQGLFQWVRS